MEYKNFKVVYRRYASLYFIIGVDSSEVNSELAVCRNFARGRGGQIWGMDKRGWDLPPPQILP